MQIISQGDFYFKLSYISMGINIVLSAYLMIIPTIRFYVTFLLLPIAKQYGSETKIILPGDKDLTDEDL